MAKLKNTSIYVQFQQEYTTFKRASAAGKESIATHVSPAHIAVQVVPGVWTYFVCFIN